MIGFLNFNQNIVIMVKSREDVQTIEKLVDKNELVGKLLLIDAGIFDILEDLITLEYIIIQSRKFGCDVIIINDFLGKVLPKSIRQLLDSKLALNITQVSEDK